jgi:hypothetical protein
MRYGPSTSDPASVFWRLGLLKDFCELFIAGMCRLDSGFDFTELSEIITERDVNDENFRVARRPDRRTPDLDSARHENVRPIL